MNKDDSDCSVLNMQSIQAILGGQIDEGGYVKSMCYYSYIIIMTCIYTYRVQEAVSLLSLLHGSAQLLIDVLRNAGSELTEEQALAAANTTLSDMSIHTLSPQLAIQILKRRIYSTS